GPEVVLPPMLTAKAERMTQSAAERSRQQPALMALESSDAGGPGGRPAAPQATPKPTAAKPQAEGKADADGKGTRSAAKDAKPAVRRGTSRRLPQPGRPRGRPG